MKRKSVLYPEDLQVAIKQIGEKTRAIMADMEYAFVPDLDWPDPTTPNMLMTCGLYRFDMPEVCMSFDPANESLFSTGIVEYLMKVYIHHVRSNSRIIQGDITNLVMTEQSTEDLLKFTKNIVAMEVDAKQFVNGFGYSIADIVTQNGMPRVIQLIVSDRSGRFQDEQYYSGIIQAIIPVVI